MDNFIIWLTLFGIVGANAVSKIVPYGNDLQNPETIEPQQTCADLHYEHLQDPTPVISKGTRLYRLQSGELCWHRTA